MASTSEVDALVARARKVPGVAEVIRTYGAAQAATRYAIGGSPAAHATMSTSTNFTRR